ncbi:MAG: PilZ domain-containing protein [bacterium]
MRAPAPASRSASTTSPPTPTTTSTPTTSPSPPPTPTAAPATRPTSSSPPPSTPTAARSPAAPPEVWTSATERRRTPRVPCTLRVEVEADGERALLTTRDLSVTGVFVFAPRVRAPGARVALVLHLGRGRLALTGRVMHAQPGVGYGVRFDGPDPGLRRRIERYLSQTEDRARPDEPHPLR